MLRTGNFARCGRHPDAVSIAGWPPPWFQGHKYTKLAPKRWFFDAYKIDHNQELYTERFRALVLAPLSPEIVFAELTALTPNPIICCWESPGEFCHRRLVAEWLETRLRIKVPEFISLDEAL